MGALTGWMGTTDWSFDVTESTTSQALPKDYIGGLLSSFYVAGSMLAFNESFPRTGTLTMRDGLPGSAAPEVAYAGCAIYQFVVSGVIVGVSCFLGMGGNIASFYILWNDPQWSVTTFLLTVLAVADSLFLLPIVFLYVMPGFCHYNGKWCPEGLHQFLPLVDQYGWAVASMCHTFTIYITVLVTWHRYVCVCTPHDVNKYSTIMIVKIQVAVVCAFAVLYNIPRFLEFDVKIIVEGSRAAPPASPSGLLNVTRSSNSSLPTPLPFPSTASSGRRNMQVTTRRTLTEIGRNSWYQVVYKNICFYVLIYIIPLITLIILTTKLAQVLRRRRKFRFRASIRSPQGREDNTTLVLIIVVIVFLICQTPTLFQRFFYAVFGDDGYKCDHFFFYFEKFADYLAVLNSCVNFIIYVLFARRFRQVLWTSLRRKTRHDYQPQIESGGERQTYSV